MIHELDRPMLTAQVPAERLERGDVGTVIYIHADGKAFEIEFMTLEGLAGDSWRTTSRKACALKPCVSCCL
jgi:hypothetical protein